MNHYLWRFGSWLKGFGQRHRIVSLRNLGQTIKERAASW